MDREGIGLVALSGLVLALLLIVPPAAGINYTPRVMANVTLTPLPTDAYQAFYDAMGGNESPVDEADARVNWTKVLGSVMKTYTVPLGNVVFVVIFAIPFILMWIMHGDVTIPSILGIILGAFILTMLPAEYHLVAVAFVALSIVAIIYSLMKERM